MRWYFPSKNKEGMDVSKKNMGGMIVLDKMIRLGRVGGAHLQIYRNNVVKM